MIPGQFDYVRPPNLADALRVLKDREGEAKVLSGGYSLIPLLKLRLAAPDLLVDIRGVAGLDGIVEAADGLRIGGRVTHRRIHEDPAVGRDYPLLYDASGGIGDPQVRNWGTLGGSCAHADPSADWPAVLIACRATIVCRSADGERTVAARDFFLDTFQTAIGPTEILTEVRIPRPGDRSGGAYEKLERKAGDFATAGAAIQLRLGQNGTIAEVGVGLTAVAETAFAGTDAEAVLLGGDPSDALYRRAGQAAAAQSRPAADGHGPVEYKRAMAAEMTVRALRRAVTRARGVA
ncbi:MAG: FAD binding domain-containing protein [Candidatus Limnocylindrales bacterium]